MSLLLLLSTLLISTTPSIGREDDEAEKKRSNFLGGHAICFVSNQRSSQIQILECPHHAFGSAADGRAELISRISRLNPDKPRFVQFCVSGQDESFAEYAPLLDHIGLNPYVRPVRSDIAVKKEYKWWHGPENALLLRLENIAELQQNALTYARIDVSGQETAYFAKREPTSAEVQWMVYAALASGFSGVIWVDGAGQKSERHYLTAIENDINPVGQGLFSSRPLAILMESEPRFYVMARADHDQIFLFILKTGLLDVDFKAAKVSVPLEDKQSDFELHFALPESTVGASFGLEAGYTTPGIRNVAFSLTQGHVSLKGTMNGSSNLLVLKRKLSRPVEVREK